MNDEPTRRKPKVSTFAAQIGAKAARKLEARRTLPSVWSGLGTMGVIGWSAVLPTLLGAALGIWIDRRHPGTHSWTLALMLIGLAAGCFSAWRWMDRQREAMHHRAGTGDE